jgi:glycosyltransferase involved in cell wall biosynthesis
MVHINSPRITVCVAAYNQSHYIRQCLESILSQEIDVSMEILVGDDCLDDRTSEIINNFCSAYPSLITHLRHPIRLGGPANMRALLGLTQGKYVARVDGVDRWKDVFPNEIVKQVILDPKHIW